MRRTGQRRRRKRASRARNSGEAAQPRRQRRNGRDALRALTSGALALPGVAGSASADTPEGRITSSYQYSFYSEDDISSAKVQSGSTRRYDVHAHQFRVGAPIADRFDLAGDGILACRAYFDTLELATTLAVARPAEIPA